MRRLVKAIHFETNSKWYHLESTFYHHIILNYVMKIFMRVRVEIEHEPYERTSKYFLPKTRNIYMHEI